MRKTFDELKLYDDFMFAKAMRNQNLCKRLLEAILQVKIERIEYPEEQKVFSLRRDTKGIRLDVYVQDDKHTIYNIEMQATNPKNLPKRSRYYQGMIDLNLLEKGSDYKELPRSYVIFICMEDIFKAGKNVYTFQNICKEDTTLTLGDETTKIFINPDGHDETIDPELRSFLRFLKTGLVTDDFTEMLNDEVNKVKQNEEWRVEYMTLEMKFKEIREEALEEGHAKGQAETVIALVNKNIITAIQGAEQLQLSLEAFEKLVEKYRK